MRLRSGFGSCFGGCSEIPGSVCYPNLPRGSERCWLLPRHKWIRGFGVRGVGKQQEKPGVEHPGCGPFQTSLAACQRVLAGN